MNAKNVRYYDSSALESSAVVKTLPGTLYSITGYNSKAAVQYIQFFDSASLPANGTAPNIMFRAEAQSNFYYDLGEIGRYCSNGIAICNSSTVATKTLGSDDLWLNVQYD